ncbi:MAG TPA: lysyl oxidase family protein [Gaiellaceae bacterium]|nr:lysyl oxidase family protein [Gaiellaceae bacterium]
MIAAAAAPPAGHEPHAPRLLVESRGGIVALDAAGRRSRLLDRAHTAAFSPDGTLVAFVRGGDLWLANADGTGERRLTRTPNTAEAAPAWLGNDAIVYSTRFAGARRLRVLRLPSGPSRVIAEDAWSPAVSAGRRLAFVSDRDGAPAVYVANADGSEAQLFDAEPPATPPLDVRDLAWSPSGRLAYTETAADGTTSLVVDDGATQTPLPLADAAPSRPVWSPDGARLAFTAADGALHTVAADGAGDLTRGAGAPTDWQVVPTGRVRYPNLVQRPPSGLLLMRQGRRWLLGFTSMIDNRGPGVLRVRANRPPHSRVMPARQLLDVAGGWTRVVEDGGELFFENAWPHFHWHFVGFDRYELRRAGSLDLVARDHKQGFCLSDDYGAAPGVRRGPPHFTDYCEQHRPQVRYVEEGASPGYTDRYPAFYEGQSLDVTRLPAGRYWLVHQANSDFHLRELRYDDDTASLLIRIAWPGGHAAAPRISTLRTCRKERC